MEEVSINNIKSDYMYSAPEDYAGNDKMGSF